MDWESFMAGLSGKEIAIIQFIVEGEPLAKLARKRHLDPSMIRHQKDRLAKSIVEFMGAEILAEIQHRPGWMDSLNTTREKFACREERRHL